MSRHLSPTLADYLVIAVSPVLIMTLVGSLTHFLVEVFYQGQYEARLTFILTLFVIAAVLIGRISIESGDDRAAMFALPLGLVTGLAIQRFVVGASLVYWLLLGLIWWATHRLTWDCTFLDESQDVTEEGLLETVGKKAAGGAAIPGEEPEGLTSREAEKRPWWEFWIDRRARPNAPGVWIIYFSLAALPIFGFGQGLIPPENVESRRYVFWLLCIYVASGLGLLMNTSFLGLRRYLRQRRLQMPGAMAGAWVTFGVVLIVGLLVLAAFLPRPDAGDPLSRLAWYAESPDRDPSRYALGKEGVHREDAEKAGTHQDQAGKKKPGKGDAPSKQEGEEKQSTEEPPQGEQDKEAGEDKPGKGDAPSKQQGKGKQDAKGSSQGEQGKETARSESKGEQGKSEARSEQPTRPSSGPRLPTGLFQRLGLVLRWLFYAVLVLLALYWLWRAREPLAAALRELLAGWREFWQKLLGRRAGAGEPATAEASQAEPNRPLSAFADPFATGAAGRLSPEELVRYTFAALEAWGRENACPREPEETPHEFVRKIGERVPSLSRELWMVADLYCRVAYAPGTLPAVTARPLEQLWQALLSRPAATEVAIGPEA